MLIKVDGRIYNSTEIAVFIALTKEEQEAIADLPRDGVIFGSGPDKDSIREEKAASTLIEFNDFLNREEGEAKNV